jgi:alpha-galactosidase
MLNIQNKHVKDDCYVSITFRNEPVQGVLYQSGLTLYDEALVNGRWLPRYWSASGFVEPEDDMTCVMEMVHLPSLSSFCLEVDGQSLHFGWELCEMKEKETGNLGTRFAVVNLRSTIRPIEVNVNTSLDGTGFISRWLTIKNIGEEPAAINYVAPLSGLLMRILNPGTDWRDLLSEWNGAPFSLGYFAEQVWGREGTFVWQPIPRIPIRIESRTGKSGHGNPFFIIRNELTGEHAVGAIEWSGNWSVEFTFDHRGVGLDSGQGGKEAHLWFKASPSNPSPLRVLAPGETVETPKVHLGYIFADFDGCVQAWHRHLRKSVLSRMPPNREGLVVYNHWGYMAHEMTEEKLKFEIDVAAEIGAEMFIVDAGWYGDKGKNWYTTVGDWECGNRLPNGLEPVFAYARERGLFYGLWLDAERIGSESKIVKEHPEWMLKQHGKVRGIGDIDLTNPKAAEWFENQLINVIERFNLDLFRLDYNTSPGEGGSTPRSGYMENSMWRYYETVYDVYERIKRRFPNLILENCAGGGGRTDLGMLSRFHYTWISDWQIAPRCIRILNGMSIALPPERIDRNAGVGQGGYMHGDLDFQIRHIMFSHMTLTGIYPNVAERNPEHVERIKHHVQTYKNFIRPFLSRCRVYHHTPVLKGDDEPKGWCVLEYVSVDSSRAIVGIFRLDSTSLPEYHLRLHGVDRGKTYKATFDNTGQIVKLEGEKLATMGILIRLERALSSELLLLEETS